MTAFSQREFRASHRFSPTFWMTACGWLATACCISALSGCSLLQGPHKEPPPPVTQKPTLPVFDPADNITKGLPLPGTYRVTSITSGELLTIQGVPTIASGRTVGAKTVAGSAVPPPSPVAETVRLAGIVAPGPGQPGWQYTVNKVHEWVDGKENLTVEVDPKFPVDLDSHRMVQIYFTPGPASPSTTGASASTGVQWNLNRMLVHTGYAVVDLYGATSIDVQKWLDDEEFAKTFVDHKQPTIIVFDPLSGKKVFKPNIKPLGLWGLGVAIPQRGTPIIANSTVTSPSDTSSIDTGTSSTGTPGVIGPVTGTSATTKRSKMTATTRNTTSSTRSVTSAPATTTRNATVTSVTTARATANVPASAASNAANALPTPR